MKLSTIILITLILMFSGTSSPRSSAQHSAETYELLSLGLTGTGVMGAYDINDANQITGAFLSPEGQRGFVWQNGDYFELDTLGGSSSFGRRINESGDVAGWAETASGEIHAALWQDGVVIDLGTLGGSKSMAYGINETGQVVGWAKTPDGINHPFQFENGVIAELPSGAGESGIAVAINDAGEIAGTLCVQGTGFGRVVVWRQGVPVELPDNGSNNSTAIDINNAGEIVGFIALPDGRRQAALWRNGEVDLVGEITGESTAYGISDTGLIAGERLTNGVSHPSVLSAGSSVALPAIAGEQALSFGVNSHGIVVGRAGTSLPDHCLAVAWVPAGESLPGAELLAER